MGQLWSNPIEVDHREMRTQKRTKAFLFYQDVRRRLEKTRNSKALRYQFANKRAAIRRAGSLRESFNRLHGKNWVTCSIHEEEGATYLFVARGDNYGN